MRGFLLHEATKVAKLAPLGAYEVRMHGISHLRWLIVGESINPSRRLG